MRLRDVIIKAVLISKCRYAICRESYFDTALSDVEVHQVQALYLLSNLNAPGGVDFSFLYFSKFSTFKVLFAQIAERKKNRFYQTQIHGTRQKKRANRAQPILARRYHSNQSNLGSLTTESECAQKETSEQGERDY